MVVQNATPGRLPHRTFELLLHALEACGFSVRSELAVPARRAFVDEDTYQRAWQHALQQGLSAVDVLSMARHYLVGVLGPEDVAVFAAPNVGEVLARLAVAWPELAGESDIVQLQSTAAGLALQWIGPRQTVVELLDGLFAIASIREALRLHAVRPVNPVAVSLSLSTPPLVAPFEQFFGCSVRFGAACERLVFAASTARVRLRTAHATEPPKLTSPLRSTRLAAVVAAVAQNLRFGAPLESVAATLELNARTLQRLLAKENTTLRALRLRAQMAEARWWLANSTRPVEDIAKRLGFSSASTFTRTFTGQHQVGPAGFRRAISKAGAIRRDITTLV